MFKKRKQKQIALLAFAVAYIIWGLNTAAIKIGLEELPVHVFIAFRFLIAGLIMLPFARRKWKKLDRKLWLRIIAATTLGYSIAISLTYYGIQQTGGVNTSILYLLAPVAMFLFSLKFLHERFNAKILTGLIVSLGGALLVVVSPIISSNETSDAQGSLIGNAIILVAIIASVLGTVLIKPVLKKVSALQITAIRFLVGGSLVLPLAMYELSRAQTFTFNLSDSVAISLIYNIVFASIIAYCLYHYGLNKLSGEESSVLHYLDPIFGVIASIMILGESLSPIIVLGAGLTLWGVYLSETSLSSKHFFAFHHKH